MENGSKGRFEGIEEGENGFGEDLEIGFVFGHFVEIGKHALNRLAIRCDALVKRAESVERHRALQRALKGRKHGGGLRDGDRRGHRVDLLLKKIDQFANRQFGDRRRLRDALWRNGGRRERRGKQRIALELRQNGARQGDELIADVLKDRRELIGGQRVVA